MEGSIKENGKKQSKRSPWPMKKIGDNIGCKQYICTGKSCISYPRR